MYLKDVFHQGQKTFYFAIWLDLKNLPWIEVLYCIMKTFYFICGIKTILTGKLVDT